MNATGNVGEEQGVAAGRGGHPRESHRECFACGIGQGGGLRLHFEVGADGLAHAIWVPEAVFRSYSDRVHGGVVATLLDSAMVHALFARGGKERGIAGGVWNFVTSMVRLQDGHSIN